MSADELSEIASTAAETLIVAAEQRPDVWEPARTGFAVLLSADGYADVDETVRLLEDTRERAGSEDRTELMGQWEARLEGMLEAHPGSADSVRYLVGALSRKLYSAPPPGPEFPDDDDDYADAPPPGPDFG